MEEASNWFQRGEAAFRHNDPRGAAEAFEQAHRLVPHGATIYNAGLAWQAAGELGRAAQAFAEALDRGGLSDAQAVDARKRMDGLSSRVGQLHVSAPAGAKITVAHFQNASPPIDVYLAPGDHVVTVQFEDGAKTTRIVRMGTSRQEFDVQPPDQAPVSSTVSQEEVESGGVSRRTLGWVAVGGAGALSGVAVYLGLEALEARDAFNESGHTDGEAHDRAASMRTWTNVAWVAAGASGVTGVVLLLGADDEDGNETSSGVMRLQVGAGSATLSGRW